MIDLGKHFGEIKKDIFDFIESLGVNPIYFVTLILLYLSFNDLDKLKRWETLEFYEKWFTLMLLGFTVFMTIVCIFYLIKDFNII